MTLLLSFFKGDLDKDKYNITTRILTNKLHIV